MRFDKEVLLKSIVSILISFEINGLHNSSQESSSETDEDEIKELKNSDTSISPKREPLR